MQKPHQNSQKTQVLRMRPLSRKLAEGAQTRPLSKKRCKVLRMRHLSKTRDASGQMRFLADKRCKVL